MQLVTHVLNNLFIYQTALLSLLVAFIEPINSCTLIPIHTRARARALIIHTSTHLAKNGFAQSRITIVADAEGAGLRAGDVMIARLVGQAVHIFAGGTSSQRLTFTFSKQRKIKTTLST